MIHCAISAAVDDILTSAPVDGSRFVTSRQVREVRQVQPVKKSAQCGRKQTAGPGGS
jgi:hypothetical protein